VTQTVLAESDVVVVGAGAVGTSIACHLARRGAAVTLVDRRYVCAETSSATFGLVWVQSKVPEPYTRLSRLSSDLYPDLIASLDDDVEYRRPGGIRVAFSDRELDDLRGLAERQRRAADLEIEVLDGPALRRLEPALGPEVVGGSVCRQDGHLNALALVNALARTARRAGARILSRTVVTGIHRRDSAVSAVETDRGLIRTRHVVNAAGVAAPEICRMVGVTLPIVPCRGQIVATQALPRLLDHPTNHVRQSPATGVVFCGETGEFAGLDTGTTLEAAREVASRAIRTLPALAGAQALRVFAGLRPWPPDGLPFLGPVRGVPGFYVVVGHSGITLAAAYGKVLTELILEGSTTVPLEPYDPLRYAGAAEVEFRRGDQRLRLPLTPARAAAAS
jgi:sarcosine oxidase subunit beta